MVVVDGHLVADWKGLAGEDVAGGDLVVLQRVVAAHGHLTSGHLPKLPGTR